MKIGVTIQLNKNLSFYSNGMFQNLFFLIDSLGSIPGWDCYFLYKSDFEPDLIIPPERCLSIAEYIVDPPFKFDVLILGGFTGDVFNNLIFKGAKLILLHCGARLMDDVFRCLHDVNSDFTSCSAPDRMRYHEVWTLPHHSHSLGYLSTIYNTKNVKVMPYIWDTFFVDRLLRDNGFLDCDDFISKSHCSRALNLNIYEPNNTICKTSLLPLAIAVEHKRHGKFGLEKCNIFCAHTLAKSKYFHKMCLMLDVHTSAEFFSFHRRIEFVNSLKLFGISSIIVSHQFNAGLNYLYLEALYLGLPLLHNSKCLSSYGYYYSESDTREASSQIDSIITSHHSEFSDKHSDNMKFIESFARLRSSNLSAYQEAIHRLVDCS